MTKDKEYSELLTKYEAEIAEAEKNKAPKELITTAKRNVRTIKNMMEEVRSAVQDEEKPATDEERDAVMGKYKKQLKRNYNFLHRVNSLFKYLGQKVYNAFTISSHENRKELLKESRKDLEELQKKREGQLEKATEKYNRSAERALKRENIKRKARGKAPLEITPVNISRFYTGRQERALARLTTKISDIKAEINSDEKEINEIETRVQELKDKKQDLLDTFHGKGKEQKALDAVIDTEIGLVKEGKTIIRETKEKELDEAEKQFDSTLTQLKEYSAVPTEKQDTKEEKAGVNEAKDITKPEQPKETQQPQGRDDTEKQPKSRGPQIRYMRQILDDGKPLKENEKYLTALSVMSDDNFHDAYQTIKKDKNIDVSAFRAAAEYIKENPGDSFKEFYNAFVYAKVNIARSTSVVTHPEAAKGHSAPAKEAPVIPEFDLSAAAEKTLDELSGAELNRALDRERKKVRALENDVTRTKNALDKITDRMENAGDHVTPKMQKEYDTAQKAFEKAQGKYEEENARFSEMKKEKSSRTKARHEYLPDEIDKEMQPSAKAVREREEAEKGKDRDDDERVR